MIKFLGFLPDVDPVTPGVVKDCNNIIPTTKGLKAVPSPIDAGITAASTTTNSLVVVRKLNDDPRTFVGTETTLEEATGGAWVDRSRTTPDYACGSDSRWSFAQFGDYTLAANVADTMQVSQTTTFADISGSPKAAYIAVSDGFVMAVNTDSSSDQWHCSAYLDYSDWVEAISTQCTSGRLIGGGSFTGVKKFSNGFVAWKKNATYVANYVGAPIVFQWDEIPGDVGCPTGHAAIDIGDRVAFLGNDDFYIFDGANNISIGQGIREWFFADALATYAHKTVVTYNPITANISWHYPSTASSSGVPDKALVYNVRSNKWSKYAITIEAAANYYPAGLTFEGIGSEYGTYDDLPTDISYDSPYWTSETALSGIMKTDHILYTLTGKPETSTLTMNSFGDDELYSTINRVRPRFTTAPESSSIDYSYDDSYGDNYTFKNTFNLNNGKYDLLHSSRWHEVKLNFVGEMEITGVNIGIVEDGTQ